ncbi:MAG: hypothetical protein ACLUFN_10890 [Eubacterium sp.]
MADVSASDINEAKKRVQQMRERSKVFVDDGQNAAEPKEESTKTEPPPKQGNGHGGNSSSGVFDILGSLFSGEDNSKAIILALILILSHEKADNMLILALLYILL